MLPILRYVFEFFASFLNQNAASRAFLSQPAEGVKPGSVVTFERRPAAPPSITYDEFVQLVIAGRASEAIVKLRSVANVEPHHLLLKEDSLARLVASLLFTWELTNEVRPVLEFMLERYPASANGRSMMAALDSLVY
jgi:hypothetical protein